MASVLWRSFVKGISWETIGFVITLFALYFVYGDFLSSLVFTLILTFFKVFLFFIHERLWKKIRWGKYHIVKGKRVYG